MWGLFAGFARKQPPHIPFSTAIPKDPNFSFTGRLSASEGKLEADLANPPPAFQPVQAHHDNSTAPLGDLPSPSEGDRGGDPEIIVLTFSYLW